jgi:hypothetical protein
MELLKVPQVLKTLVKFVLVDPTLLVVHLLAKHLPHVNLDMHRQLVQAVLMTRVSYVKLVHSVLVDLTNVHLPHVSLGMALLKVQELHSTAVLSVNPAFTHPVVVNLVDQWNVFQAPPPSKKVLLMQVMGAAFVLLVSTLQVVNTCVNQLNVCLGIPHQPVQMSLPINVFLVALVSFLLADLINVSM